MSDDLIKVNQSADGHFKTVRYEATLYLAYDTAEILQLWKCPVTGKTEWRSLPDVEDFCEDHGITSP